MGSASPISPVLMMAASVFLHGDVICFAIEQTTMIKFHARIVLLVEYDSLTTWTLMLFVVGAPRFEWFGNDLSL